MVRASLHHSALTSRDIALLLAVAEDGSIRRAAETLGISQPSLSKSIRLIEERLGAALFERSTAGAQPTAIGEELLSRGRQVLLDLASIQRDLADASHGQIGEVRVGAGALIAPLVTGPLVRAIRADAPGITLSISQMHQRDIVAQVETGALDFAVCSLEDLALPTALQSQVACRLPPVFFARRDHPLTRRLRLTAPMLAEFRLALPNRYPRFEAWFCRFTGAARCDVGVEGHNYDLIGEIVEGSDDISSASPDIVARIQRRFDIEALYVPGIDFVHEAHWVWPAARSLSPAARRVRAMLGALLQERTVAMLEPVFAVAANALRAPRAVAV